MASFMHQHHSGSDAESEPEETDNRQAASNRGASHFAAFASSKTANWRDALMSDPEEDDDHELDARALIAEAHKAINADHVSNDPKQNTALCASTSTSQARLDDSLLIDGPLAKQRDSAPTSPESQQGAQAPLAHKQTSRRINHGSDDDLEQPPSVPPASSSKGDKLHQLAAARREREIQKQAAADKNKQPVTTEIDEDANLTVQIVDDDLEDDEEPSLKVGGGGIFKPGKNKGNLVSSAILTRKIKC